MQLLHESGPNRAFLFGKEKCRKIKSASLEGGKGAVATKRKPPLAGNSITEQREHGNACVVKSTPVSACGNESCVAKSLSVPLCNLKSQFCVAKIRGSVNGRSVAMLVDTGSSVTIGSDAVTTGCDTSPVGAVTVSSATGDSVK
jgi:hypothetical protein